jgi:hypothetical protein
MIPSAATIVFGKNFKVEQVSHNHSPNEHVFQQVISPYKAAQQEHRFADQSPARPYLHYPHTSPTLSPRSIVSS